VKIQKTFLATAGGVLLAALAALLISASSRRSGARTPDNAQIPDAPPSPGPDDRYKADILVVVAHPDDETEITGYLARAIYDEHKRVAVIFGTRGDGGGNAMGYEQAAALGAEREIEARRALAYFGIMNVWFLDGPDTPGQDVLRSLETWNHGSALAKTVRLVRLTRPEVILTWLPAYVAGENHDDHQAAGVIATEAFDLAGDPTAFPEQVAAPRDRTTIGNLTEGLRPWQPKKIYYFSDASHVDFLEGKGPKYETTVICAARQLPYYRLAAEEMSFHLTQGDTGQEAKKALATGQFKYFQQPVRFIFGKSLVNGSTTGDIFHVNFNGLPGPHVRELRLLKVCCHPDVVQGHDFQHFLADAHVLTNFNGFLSNDSRHWRANDRVAEIQLCLGEFGLALLHLRICGIGPGDGQRYLLGRSLRSSQISFCLDQFSFRLTYALLSSLDSCMC